MPHLVLPPSCAAGAGKTTLMDVAAGRKTVGRITGEALGHSTGWLHALLVARILAHDPLPTLHIVSCLYIGSHCLQAILTIKMGHSHDATLAQLS